MASPLTPRNSTTVSARIALSTAFALRRHAQARGVEQGVLLRRLIHLVLAKDPSTDALATIVDLLGLDLPPDEDKAAIRAAIVAAVDSLLESDEPEEAPPAKPAKPVPMPADPLSSTAEYAAEQRALAKITDPAARAKFIALRKQRRADRLNGSAKNQKASK